MITTSSELWEKAKNKVFEYRSTLSAADLEPTRLSYEQFIVLEKPAYNILDPEKLEATKQEVLATIQSVGVEQLTKGFETFFLNILERERTQPTPKEKRIIAALHNSARFVRDVDPTFLTHLRRVVLQQHGQFIHEVTAAMDGKEMQSEIDRVPNITVARTIEQLINRDTKSLQLQQIQSAIRKIYIGSG